MLAAGLPRLLCRLAARRCPAGLRPLRAARRGGARGEEEEGGGRTGFARRRWARPAGGALGFLGALSLFPRNAEEDGEDAIVLLLKKAKLSVMKGELGEAERILHQALRLSQQADNRDAIVYTSSMMANVAYMQGQLDNDDNAILEMSLKLASIYASQKQHKLAVAGYQFCILTLEEKIAKQKDLPEDVLPVEEKANTRLLLGMSLDSYARYLLNINQLPVAQQMYEKALQISNDVQGETHPQTVVLMNDLATVLDAQGHYDEAYSYVKRAAELAKETQHPEEHMVLNNLAAILMHKEDFLQAKQVYKEALKQAQQKGDIASVQHIQEELAELAKRRKGSK
ncbi:tetratricopeptide repeat protein 19, mitochondrial isoform X3 [Caloenas nicobarica]|uniref:tetratricopeptide repeat protein 19, mitochondrial isoform X3 n=1 Tax=Caloenas nicobarica TaxID=187106 RepID=UPI0032B86DFB